MGRYYKKELPRVDLTRFARELRKKATPEEEALWERIRDRRCQGLKFRRQHVVGPYIVDFYCAEKRLILELDGSQHYTVEGRRYDSIRDWLTGLVGLQVLRIENSEIRGNLEEVLNRIASIPTPSSPLERPAGSSGEDRPGEARPDEVNPSEGNRDKTGDLPF